MQNKRTSYVCARAGNMRGKDDPLTQSGAMSLAHKEYDEILKNPSLSNWEREYASLTESEKDELSYGRFIATKAGWWSD